MKLPPPLIRRLDQPLRCYVCHRGVEPALVQEIAVYFREKGYAVIVQSGDGLALSFSEFRRATLAHLAAGCDNLVVLLNKNFSSPIYRHTLGVVEAKAERELPAGHSYVIRIEDGGRRLGMGRPVRCRYTGGATRDFAQGLEMALIDCPPPYIG